MTDWTLSDIAAEWRAIEALERAGFSVGMARRKGGQFARLAERLKAESHHGSARAAAWFVPGRIEVFGKHTDYAGGRSVVAAAERGFCGVAVARDDDAIQLIDQARQLETQFPLGHDPATAPAGWSNYPLTVVRRMLANFETVRQGVSIAFASDLPPAAGMSSSSALMVMTFLLVGELNQLAQDPAFQENIRSTEELAEYLGAVENGQTFQQLAGDQGVGTFGGSEDHAAMLCARSGRWTQFSYCPVRRERTIKVPVDYSFVIGVCGVVAEKTGAARELYNRAARRAREVTTIWQSATRRDDPHLAAIVRSYPDAVRRLRQLLHECQAAKFSSRELVDRLDQFAAENEEIIPAVPDGVCRNTIERVGELAERSQRLAAAQLGNQIPETECLVKTARQLGAVAASAQGAGFGGSVWALVPAVDIESFSQRWAAAYRRRFPEAGARGSFFATASGPPATSLSGSEAARVGAGRGLER